MPALRQPVKRLRPWFLIAAVAALVATAVFDWMRPPPQQVSVQLWQRGIVGSYRAVVRPLVHRFVRCRFYPTCTTYSVQAVQLHGLPRGFWLTARRLLRCHPWTPMGTFDPVPMPAPPLRSAQARPTTALHTRSPHAALHFPAEPRRP